MPVLKNVVLLYPKLNTPVLEYQKELVEDKPWFNKEYVVDALISAAEYKKLKATYKTVKSVKDAVTIDAADFEEKFKMVPPEGYENGDGEYIIVKFRKKAYYMDGNEGFPPKIMGCTKSGRTRDGEVIDSETPVGMGTLCNLQYKERIWDNKFGKGLALDLAAVAILNLVRYESSGGDVEDEMFEEDDEMEEGMEEDSPAPTKAGKAKSTPAPTEADDGGW